MYKKVIKRAPDYEIAHRHLAATYIDLGREEEARAEAAEVLRINPKFSLERFAKRRMQKNKAALEREIDALRKAGLPD